MGKPPFVPNCLWEGKWRDPSVFGWISFVSDNLAGVVIHTCHKPTTFMSAMQPQAPKNTTTLPGGDSKGDDIVLSPVVLRKGITTHFLHVVWSCSIRRPRYEKNCYIRRKKKHLENWWRKQSFYYIINCPIFNISLAECLQIDSPSPPSGRIFNSHPPH